MLANFFPLWNKKNFFKTKHVPGKYVPVRHMPRHEPKNRHHDP